MHVVRAFTKSLTALIDNHHDRKTNNGLFVNVTISASLGTVTWTGTLTDTANQGSSLLSTVAMAIFWRPYNFQHSSKAINLLFQ